MESTEDSSDNLLLLLTCKKSETIFMLKTLEIGVVLRLGINFTSILQATFEPISFQQKNIQTQDVST